MRPVKHINIIQGKILLLIHMLNKQCKICVSFAVKYILYWQVNLDKPDLLWVYSFNRVVVLNVYR